MTSCCYFTIHHGSELAPFLTCQLILVYLAALSTRMLCCYVSFLKSARAKLEVGGRVCCGASSVLQAYLEHVLVMHVSYLNRVIGSSVSAIQT
jgi:hypothetical protein